MEKSERDDLEALARDAASGPWCLHPNGSSVWQGDEYDSEGAVPQALVAQVTLDKFGVENAAFIAAANPSAVLELLGGYGISETHPDEGEDGEEVCDVCGYIAPSGHTHATCFSRGKDTGAIDENTRCAELLSEVLGIEYNGESFTSACEHVVRLLGDALLLAKAHEHFEGYMNEQERAAFERVTAAPITAAAKR